MKQPRATGSGPRVRVAFWTVFAAALVLKLVLLPYRGTGDMQTALDYGRWVLDYGFADGFGLYPGNFPVAFQIYTGLVEFCRLTGADGITAMKSLILACDLFSFLLFRSLLRSWGRNEWWALLYWAGPYTLVLFALGYDHFEMGLLVLLSLWLMQRARTTRGMVAAAVPFALGFLQRPQVEGLVVMLGLYGLLVAVADVRATRRLRPREVWAAARPVWVLLGASAALFVLFSAYFWTAHPTSPFYLVHVYVDITRFSTGLNGGMANIWGVVAEHYRAPTERLDQVATPAIYHSIAGLVTAVVFVAGAVLVFRARRRDPTVQTILWLFAIAAIVAPNTYTRAHEPHFFLGAVFGIMLLAFIGDRILLAAFNASLVLQAVNVLGLYGLGRNDLSTHQPIVWLRTHWTNDFRVWVDLVNVALFLIIAWRLVRRLRADGAAIARPDEVDAQRPDQALAAAPAH